MAEQNIHIPKTPEDVQIGDIFHASFGCGMRLNHFWQVVARTKSTVTLRLLNAQQASGDGWSGTEGPMKDNFMDYSSCYDNLRKVTPSGVYAEKVCKFRKGRGLSMKIDNYEFAYPWFGNLCSYDHMD